MLETNRARAVLFGLNYTHVPGSELRGCVNDVMGMAEYLRGLGIKCETYTDDTDTVTTSARGMLRKLDELAVASHVDRLAFVWIHYSGHGVSIKDTGGDEKDGSDECIVPSDFKVSGVISDDTICEVLAGFNKDTRVVCVFDACHSATIADLNYSWNYSPRSSLLPFLNRTVEPSKTIENSGCNIAARVISLSGCMDYQTSADAAYNIIGSRKYAGAMTTSLLEALREHPEVLDDVFLLLRTVHRKLLVRCFFQRPALCSTYDLELDKALIPTQCVRRPESGSPAPSSAGTSRPWTSLPSLRLSFCSCFGCCRKADGRYMVKDRT
jgi:hypothetical protein